MHTDIKVSFLIQNGLWAESAIGRSEMALEKLMNACYDHNAIRIIVDVPIPGGGETGLKQFVLKHGAGSVEFVRVPT